MSTHVPTRESLKEKAKVIRKFLKEKCNVEVSHSHCIEIVSKALDFKDWNTASAASKSSASPAYPISIKTVGEMREALAPFKDSDSLDADFTFKVGDILDDCEDYSPNDEIHQEFRFVCPKQDNKMDDETLVTLLLELEHESISQSFEPPVQELCDYWKNKNSDEL